MTSNLQLSRRWRRPIDVIARRKLVLEVGIQIRQHHALSTDLLLVAVIALIQAALRPWIHCRLGHLVEAD